MRKKIAGIAKVVHVSLGTAGQKVVELSAVKKVIEHPLAKDANAVGNNHKKNCSLPFCCQPVHSSHQFYFVISSENIAKKERGMPSNEQNHLRNLRTNCAS